jgi:plasmid replication initiation protein
MENNTSSISKNLVYQSNELIEAHYKQEYTVQEQRTVLWLISEVHKRNLFCKQEGKIYEHGIIKISAQKYADMMNVSVYNIYRDAQKIGRELMGKVIKIENETGWEMFHWVSHMKYVKHEAVIEVSLSPGIVPYIIDLEQYSEFKLENILYLNSSHAIKIYQLLSQYRKIGERIISVNDFRSILGISELKTYSAYGSLKKKILELAKREINSKTDLSFSYSEIKKSRKVDAIKFKITSKHSSEEKEKQNSHSQDVRITKQQTKISTIAFEQAKEIALAAKTGWDIYVIEQQFYEYAKKSNDVRSVDATFIGFVRKKVTKNPK